MALAGCLAAGPALARPAAIGLKPLIGMSRTEVVATFRQLGWSTTANPPEGPFVIKALSAENDATEIFAHLDVHRQVVGVSILVGKEDGTYVRDHLAALDRWCKGSGSTIPTRVERDVDGDGIAEVDVGRYTDPATGKADLP